MGSSVNRTSKRLRNMGLIKELEQECSQIVQRDRKRDNTNDTRKATESLKEEEIEKLSIPET